MRADKTMKENELRLKTMLDARPAGIESEEKFRLLFDAACDPILLLDDGNRFIYCNEAAVQIMGAASKEQLLMQHPAALSPEYQPDGQLSSVKAEQIIRTAFNHGKMKFEWVHSRLDGSSFIVEVSLALLTMDDRKVQLVHLRDITDRKLAEEALRKSEEELKFKNIILSTQQETSIDGILVVDERGTIVSYNRRFVDMWGIPPEVAESKSDELALQSVLDKLVAPESFLARVKYLYEHKDEKSQEEIVLKDGRVFDRYSAPMLGANGGEYYGRVWYFRDITGRKRAEEKRLHLETRLQEMQKLESLSILAGGVAHDFNNMLQPIIGYAQLARMQAATPGSPFATFLDNIELAAKRAARLAGQMLTYSGYGRFQVESVELSLMVQAFSPLLTPIAAKSAELRFHLSPDLPPIDADLVQLQQVILGLVTNAVEAIGENDGAVIIRTGTMKADRSFLDATVMGEELPEGEYVFLEVADSGGGIPADILPRIFDPFFSTKFAGRGLGLAAIHGIVRGHHGTIMVESRPGQGTAFRILFPCASLPDQKPAQQEAAPATSWHGTGKVLVVDDDATVLEVCRLMLESLGFTVLTAGDSMEGLTLFRERSSDIAMAFVDLTMPRMEGKELVRELRRINPGVKVVLISGYTKEAIPSDFIAEGVADFLQKPFKVEELVAVLNLMNLAPVEVRHDEQ